MCCNLIYFKLENWQEVKFSGLVSTSVENRVAYLNLAMVCESRVVYSMVVTLTFAYIASAGSGADTAWSLDSKL